MAEVESDAPSNLEKKIIKQVEYYFGDINLPRDKFLQEQVKEDADGWVTMEIMLKFNRLKELSDKADIIVAALQKSTSGLMEVSEDKKSIRRSPMKPVPENTAEYRAQLAARSVYAKGFPLDATLDEASEFLSKFGKVESIQMRKDAKKKFKGSIFGVFSSLEDAEKFVKEDSIKYKDFELIRKFRTDYHKGKEEEKKQRDEQREAEKEKKRQKNKDKKGSQDEKKIQDQITPGAMLQLKGFSKDITREDIKGLLQEFAPIAWVDYEQGDKQGWLRYDEKDQAKVALEKITAKLGEKFELKGATLEAKVLEGEEELEAWKKMFQDIADRRSMRAKLHKDRYGRRQGGRRPFKRKNKPGKADDDEDDDEEGGEGEQKNGAEDEPPVKQAKTEVKAGDSKPESTAKTETPAEEPPAKKAKTEEAD